ncbi:hypothetical protein QJS04_geneDACA023352 [Acorus gramineus]|uniref:Uncharacterized protein n=1 Tax=Acorus gramineus TaxID=55184 RepID=A0AAV9BVK9_ACOGR|nr:hypothetical protein QJS04_geneDACA023352 [Acorus gramineus]
MFCVRASITPSSSLSPFSLSLSVFSLLSHTYSKQNKNKKNKKKFTDCLKQPTSLV